MNIIERTRLAVVAVALATAGGAAGQEAGTPAGTQAAGDLAPAAANGWTPLDEKHFFSELGQAWIPVPNGSGGAPRQGWLATADGFFTREVHLAYDYVERSGAPDSYEVLGRFNYPLSRRLWIGTEIPFHRETGDRGDLGDITVTPEVMLHETRNVSINAGVGLRLPTGSGRLGERQFVPTPEINYFSDLGRGFALRARLGYSVGDKGNPDNFVLNAAIGQTFTPHDRAPFGDATWYVSVNYAEPIDARSARIGRDARSFVSITPGVRTHLGGNLFLLGGVEFPVVNRGQSFDERYIVQLVQGF